VVRYIVKTIIFYVVHRVTLLKPSSLGKSCSISRVQVRENNLPGPLERAIQTQTMDEVQNTVFFQHRVRSLT
jgi:hypothetical protein